MGDDMFLGKYSYNLDEKNRIIIPAKFRETLGGNAIITKGYDGCLAIYRESDWLELQKKLLGLNNNNPDVRRHIRIILSCAVECSYDKQGRISLPADLLKDFGMEKECIIVGNLNQVEIWSKNNWESYFGEAFEKFEENAEKLVG